MNSLPDSPGEQITRGYSQESIRRLSEQIASIQRTPAFREYAAAQSMAAAAERFEEEVEGAGALPETEPGPSPGWWLASRPLLKQVALLYAALQVLDAVEARLLEDASGNDVPDPVQAATQVCFAVVAFLILWLSERDQSGD